MYYNNMHVRIHECTCAYVCICVCMYMLRPVSYIRSMFHVLGLISEILRHWSLCGHPNVDTKKSPIHGCTINSPRKQADRYLHATSTSSLKSIGSVVVELQPSKQNYIGYVPCPNKDISYGWGRNFKVFRNYFSTTINLVLRTVFITKHLKSKMRC